MTIEDNLIQEIIMSMTPELTDIQLSQLKTALEIKFHNYSITKIKTEITSYQEKNYNKVLKCFANTKILEGCSEKTVESYYYNIEKMLISLDKNIEEIRSDDLRYYLAQYKVQNKVSNVTLDNMRRYFLSFFTWAQDEQIITSNPAKALNKIKQEKVIKQPLTDEEIELLRMNCKNERDRALIEFLYSTGIRVGELEKLNRSDINFQDKSVIVWGKGAKERVVYLNAKSIIYLQKYFESREDDNEALFVGLRKPHNRLKVSSIEKILRDLGNSCGVKANPHKFRRTAATSLLNKGMPVQEVSKLLGHSKLETTMIYCTVEQENVKNSHRKYSN